MRRLFFLLFAVFSFQTVSSAKWGWIPLDDLVQTSDLIVVGTLQNISEYSKEGMDYGEGTIVVEEVIWSNTFADKNLTLKWQNSSNIVCPRVEHAYLANQKGIWLLNFFANEVRADYPGRFALIEQRAEIEKILNTKSILLQQQRVLVAPDDPFTVTLVFRNSTDKEMSFPGFEYDDNYLFLSPYAKLETYQLTAGNKKLIKPITGKLHVSQTVTSIIVPPKEEVRFNLNLKSIFQIPSKDKENYSVVFKVQDYPQSNEARFYVTTDAPILKATPISTKVQTPQIIKTINETPRSLLTPFVRAFLVFILELFLYFWLYRYRKNYW
jgi:hypothetical protein